MPALRPGDDTAALERLLDDERIAVAGLDQFARLSSLADLERGQDAAIGGGPASEGSGLRRRTGRSAMRTRST